MDELFRYNIRHMQGQLHDGTPVGKHLTEIVKDPELKTFLECGTWNGQGSTLCIMNGLVTRDDDTVFVSLEADQGRNDVSKDFWNTKDKGHVDLQLLHGKLSEEVLTREYVINHPKFSDQLQYFDIEMSQTNDAVLIGDQLPESIDFVFLDGGEFCSLGDFNFVMKKYAHSLKVIGLDDIDTIKNSVVYEHLTQEGSPWKVVASGGHPGRPGRDDGPQKSHTWAFFKKE